MLPVQLILLSVFSTLSLLSVVLPVNQPLAQKLPTISVYVSVAGGATMLVKEQLLRVPVCVVRVIAAEYGKKPSSF